MQNAIDIIKKQIQGRYPDNKFRFVKFDYRFEMVSIKYEDLTFHDQKPEVLQTSEYTNDTSVENKQAFAVDKTTSNSFAWSITEGIELGSEFEVSIPFVGDTKSSIKLNFSSTQQQTTSVVRHWKYEAQIPVPPRSKVETTFSVIEGKVDTGFVATFQVRGFLRIEFDISKPGQSADWRYCEGDIAEMLRQGYCITNPRTFECTASGRFSGIDATTYVVHTKEVKSGKVMEFARSQEPLVGCPTCS